MKNEKRNKNNRKNMLLMVLAFLMCVLTACGSTDIVSYYGLEVLDATSDFYVNDFASVLSEEQKAQLMANAVSMDEEYSGIQVVVTTVETLDSAVLGYKKCTTNSEDGTKTVEEVDMASGSKSFTIEEITYSMFSQYGIGQDDMGILVLLSIGDREVRIETGYQMQNFITDAVSGQLLDDYAMPYLGDDQFAEGLISLQTAIIAEIKERVPKDWQNSIIVTPTETEDDATERQEQITPTDDTTEKNGTEKGFLAGIIGSIGAAILAFIALICSIFTRKAKIEELKEQRDTDLATQKQAFQSKISDMEQNHQQEIRSLNAAHNQALEEKDREIRNLTYDLSDSQREVDTLRASLENIADRYARAQRLHPEYNLETEINEMIEGEYKAAAENIDSRLASAYSTPANKDNINVFAIALSLFDEAPPEVRKYISSDRTVLAELYSTSVAMQKEFQRLEKEKADKAVAADACDRIRVICNENQKGNYQTYEALNSAMRIFLALTAAQKAFFPDDTLIYKLRNMHSVAENDHNDYQAAKKAEVDVQSIIRRCSTPDEDDRDDLNRAMIYYRNLTTAQQKYFSDELLSRVKRMIRQADEDHDEQERRRRARRNSSYSSGFRSGSSRGFSGHGGRPSGGGASRRF